MAEPDYTPEFIEVLNAWEQTPPLTAEFVFDLPPGDTRKADKVGVLMYQAVLMKQDHAELDFSRIRAVTFTMDVHRTGDELERIVGHDLPHYRNAAARLDVFHINLGAGQVFIITDELAVASLSPLLATRLAAWELLRTELARSVAVAALADVAPAGEASQPSFESARHTRWLSIARYAWTEYFCGFHAGVQGLQTPMARNRLRSALEEDPVALAQAIHQFAADADRAELTTRAEGCVKGLFEAMSEVLGQLAAAGLQLSTEDPHLDTLIRTHALTAVWESLARTLAALGTDPRRWSTLAPLGSLVALGQQYLGTHGVEYGADELAFVRADDNLPT